MTNRQAPVLTSYIQQEWPIDSSNTRVYLLNRDNFLVENTNKRIVQCKIATPTEGTTKIKCVELPDARPPFDIDKTNNRLEMRALYGKYAYKHKNAIIYYNDYKILIRCRLDMKAKFIGIGSNTIELQKLKCTQISLDFTQGQIENFIAGHHGIDTTHNSMILSFYSKQGSLGSGLAGYIRADFQNYRTVYADLSNSQGTHLSPINSTYYIIHRGDHTSLHIRTKNRFYIQSPGSFTPTSEVFLSSYSPARGEEPLVVSTQVNRMNTHQENYETEDIGVMEVDDFSYYDLFSHREYVPEYDIYSKNVACQNLGLNSRLLKGNDLRLDDYDIGHYNSKGQIQMVMEAKKIVDDAKAAKKPLDVQMDSDLLKKIKTFPVDSKSLGLMFNQDHIRGLDSKNAIKIKTEGFAGTTEFTQFFGLEDGVIVYKSGSNIMIIRCSEAPMGKTEVVCKKISQISATNHELLQAYFYFKKLYIISKNTSSKKYELLRFNEEFKYIPPGATPTPTETVSAAIDLSSAAEIKWDLKIISDDIYIFISELSTGDTNDVPKMIQITVENDKISSTQLFNLNLKANGILKFKCGDIQFLPGSSREIFIINKGELVEKKYFTVLKVWYKGINQELDLTVINRFPLRKVG